MNIFAFWALFGSKKLILKLFFFLNQTTRPSKRKRPSQRPRLHDARGERADECPSEVSVAGRGRVRVGGRSVFLGASHVPLPSGPYTSEAGRQTSALAFGRMEVNIKTQITVWFGCLFGFRAALCRVAAPSARPLLAKEERFPGVVKQVTYIRFFFFFLFFFFERPPIFHRPRAGMASRSLY